ncbi:MAG: efflux RND transporter periplasmic adaptor subunit [Mucilaginibacter polytrichastri]|nr:efflux RND transporter periplasmic adaptor subunit [Mucilaginibacter polytrichastri]
MYKKYFLFCLSLAGLAAILSSCTTGTQAKNSTDDRPRVPVITLKTRDTVFQKPYVADIQAIKNVEIRCRVKGFIEKIFVDEGMFVKKGQQLFHINDEEYRASVARTQATLTGAIADVKAIDLELDRVKMLVKKKVISESEVEVTEAKRKAIFSKITEARTELENSRRRLAFTTVRAPFDGYVGRIPLRNGSLVDEGSLLTALSDISAVFAYFEFPETEYLQYSRLKKDLKKDSASRVRLVLADGSKYAYPGQIETIEGEIEQNTGSIAFRARFPNPDRLLRHGATGRIYIASKANNILLVPQKSVFDIQDKSYVFVVDDQNKLHMKNFERGARFSHFYLVKKGLDPDERIVYEGVQNVRDGMTVVPTGVSADSLLVTSNRP